MTGGVCFAIRRALKVDPDSVTALYAWGCVCLNHRKSEKDAARAWQRVLKNDPRHAAAKKALGGIQPTR